MMDRRQLLDRAARNGDERVLLAHILDKCEQSRNRNIPSATDFLSPAEQRSAQDLLHAAAIHDGCAFCGGFERAERRMLLFLPNWQEIREKVLDICRYLGELEYLGFDIAITEEGFQVIEINIHQDLHKVATHSQEIKDFFAEKIRIKKSIYKLK